MTILDSLKQTAKSAAVAIGLAGHPNMPAYRKARELADQLPALTAQQRETGRRLADAQQALRDGAPTYDGLRIEAAIGKLQSQYEGVANKVFYASKAANECVGLAPDDGLQRERRELSEQTKRAAGLAASTEQRIHRINRELKGRRAWLEQATHVDQGSEREKASREISLHERDLKETTERLESLREELRQIAEAKEDMRRRALTLPI
jgi:chromosome segregation ATPase